jgi:hypothetical protein
MYSQYKLCPSISQTNTLYYERREHDQVVKRHSKYPLPVGRGDYEHRSNGGMGGIPISTSNSSLIDFDIDTSDFMNMKSPFPWDDNQLAYCYAGPNHSVRYSSPSSSSTTQGSCSSNTSLLYDANDPLDGTLQSRESILIPDFPQDLAYHRVKSRESRPANLRTSSEDPVLHTAAIKRCSLSEKKSITPLQLDCLAGALGSKSNRLNLMPQLSFESSYIRGRPPTLSLSSPSTVTSSSALSTMSPPSDSERIPDVLVTRTASVGVSSTGGAKSGSDPRSSDQGSLCAASKRAQRQISGPILHTEYPSMMNLTTSPFSAEIYYPEGAFQPRRKTPKPPSSAILPPIPATSTTQAEPPSWFDLDDDANDRANQHRNLTTKLSIPHIRHRADSPSKKTTPVPALTSKRRSEDSITITTNLIQLTDSRKSRPANKLTPAHISFPSSTPAVAPTKESHAIFLTKPSFGSRILGQGHSRSTETLKREKKPKTLKVGSSSKDRKRSSERKSRAWFQRFFG